MKVGVLVSGSGTIFDAIVSDEIPVEVMIADRPCAALGKAEAAGVAAELVERESFGADFDRDSYTDRVVEVLRKYEVDLVAIAGFGTVVPGLARAYPGRAINTHPALLPAFKGWHAVREALKAGVTETGCTVHVVTEEVDSGPILAQETVAVEAGDTEESLHERIKEVERRLYPSVIRQIIEGDIQL